MRKLPLYLILFLIVCVACGRSNRSILDEAAAIVREDQDSALTLLRLIDQPQQLKGKDKADYWWVKSFIHNWKGQAMGNDSLILYSLNYYKHSGDSARLAKSYILAGRYFSWAGQLDSVEVYLHEALKIAKQLNDTTLILSALSNLAYHDFMHMGRERTAAYGKERLKYRQSHFIYYLIGITDQGNDSLQYFRDKSIELALQKGDSMAAAHYLRNYAYSLYEERRYNEVIAYLERTGEISDHYKDFGANHRLMALIHLDKADLDSAQLYLDKAKKEATKGSYGEGSPLNAISDKNDNAILQNVIDYARGKRIETGEISRYNDSIINSIIQKNRSLQENLSDMELSMQQNNQLFHKKQRVQHLLLISICLFLLCAGGGYVWILRKKRKYREIEERTETLQHLFREALNVKDVKEENSLLFRKTLMQQLGMIRLIATNPGKPNKELLGRIINISEETVSTDTLLKWDDLYPVIDSVYDGFYTNLVERYGAILSEKEIRLCCLLRAEFSTGEISAVMQQSNQTIYQRKSNIRKKIGAGEKEDIYVFLVERFGELA